jgi:5-methyltetrahydrofolate--homocysteine methyltransferase
MSAFLRTTMPMFKKSIEAMTEAGLRGRVKVLVGGAPVTQEYADTVGADGYAPDANSCVRLTKKLLNLVE